MNYLLQDYYLSAVLYDTGVEIYVEKIKREVKQRE